MEGGGSRWMFWTADGFYFLGDFDGYEFKSDEMCIRDRPCTVWIDGMGLLIFVGGGMVGIMSDFELLSLVLMLSLIHI